MNRTLHTFVNILLVATFTFCIVGNGWSGEPKKYLSGMQKPDGSLTETYWKLLTLNGKKVHLGAGEKELQMVLKETGKVNGFSGCNRFMGSFHRQGTQLQFGPLAATMMMCAETMEQEQMFLKAMESSDNYIIQEEILRIYNDEKIEILRFESVYLQ